MPKGIGGGSSQLEDVTTTEGLINTLANLAIAFKDVYGTLDIKKDMKELKADNNHVMMPGLVKSNKTGRIRPALLNIAVASSGERWDTAFIVEDAVFYESATVKTIKEKEVLEEFMPYDYAYIGYVEEDMHMDYIEWDMAHIIKEAHKLVL